MYTDAERIKKKNTKKNTHTHTKLPPEKELKITVFCETATSVSKC